MGRNSDQTLDQKAVWKRIFTSKEIGFFAEEYLGTNNLAGARWTKVYSTRIRFYTSRHPSANPAVFVAENLPLLAQIPSLVPADTRASTKKSPSYGGVDTFGIGYPLRCLLPVYSVSSTRTATITAYRQAHCQATMRIIGLEFGGVGARGLGTDLRRSSSAFRTRVAKLTTDAKTVTEFQSPLESPETRTETGSAAGVSANNVVKLRKQPGWIEDQLANEQLQSTLEHRLWVGSTGALLGALLGRGLLQVHDLPTALEAGVAVFTAYLTADLLSGVYHWGIDNYGSPSTPVFGKQIEGFQGHHEYPWTITYREFCNKVHPICKPSVPFVLACLSVHPAFVVDIWAAVGTALVVCSQQFHSWSHCKRSELSDVVLKLQEAGLVVSTAEHCRHHRPPFDSNYCIVSGAWNPLLDNSGFFRVLEKIVHRMTGVEPRCWNEKGQPSVSYYKD